MQVRQRSGESVIAIMRGGPNTDAVLQNGMVELVTELARPHGYVARTYENCGEVLAGVRAGHVQAVVVCSWKDWRANGPLKHKGLELLVSLRGDPIGCTLPVCVLTGAPGAAVDPYGISADAGIRVHDATLDSARQLGALIREKPVRGRDLLADLLQAIGATRKVQALGQLGSR